MTTKTDRAFQERLGLQRAIKKQALLRNSDYTSCMNNTKWAKWFEEHRSEKIKIKKVSEDEVIDLSSLAWLWGSSDLEYQHGWLEYWEIEWVETENEKVLGYHRVT